jgi:hypothetical protein
MRTSRSGSRAVAANTRSTAWAVRDLKGDFMFMR